MKPLDCKQNLEISFDIGHSSIGWSVLRALRPHPEVLGCGTVIFPKDDCLASQRRSYRRSRRNIRSTRKRIANMKKLFLHLGVLDAASLDLPGHAAPHVLAARALLTEGPCLTWLEIWHVLRWYAHNRGYDGNARWSHQEENDDDTEKEKAAKHLMDTHGTETMAETVCAVLGIDPTGGRISSDRPFKTLNAAFPRKTVRNEVLTILQKHLGHLPKLDEAFIECLIQHDRKSAGWKSMEVTDLKLPKRYEGGLLFGQLVPRFDNRIISICPISGHKVPNKATREFLDYRWAMLLANIKADGKPLSPEQRQAVHKIMMEKGKLTPTELRQKVEEITGTTHTNIRGSFEIHPDSKDALVLDPVTALQEKANQAPGKNATFELSMFWPHLPEAVQNRAVGRWRKGRLVNLAWMREQLIKEHADSGPLDLAIDQSWKLDQTKKKPQFITRDHLLRKPFAPELPSGRAPYSRSVMREVVDFVLSTDRHPTEVDGPIYRSPEVLKAQRARSIADQTNNHLIRHRLLILERLMRDIIKHYADGDASQITDIVIEVARDLQEYSGMTAKEMAGELTKRLSHFKSAVKYLGENAPDMPVTGSLIRKCRIAMDMDWKCPFTGKKYDAIDLPKMEREHIIPFADRPTNALDAQVLTFDWVNRLKGKRTAMRFILDMTEDDRFLSPQNYRKLVDGLKVAPNETYPDDHRRQKARKKWLLLEDYSGEERSFTQGELTQTSHLNRLSQRQLERIFTNPETGDCTVRIHALPGQVTAEARKAWNLLGTLVQACPECRDKTKTEIREITHLHHALDAVTLGLIHHYMPGRLPGQMENEKGALWRAMLQRNKTEADIALLLRTGVFKPTERQDKEGRKRRDAELVDLERELKNQIAARLAETRVVQHIPADQSGAMLEETSWRVVGRMGEHVVLVQNEARTSLESVSNAVPFRWKEKPTKKKAVKLLDQFKHLLSIKQVHLIKRGLMKITTEHKRAVVGLKGGKLEKNKAVKIINRRYGLALGNEPTLIYYHDVPKQLAELRKKNSGKMPEIIKIGSIIRVASGTWQGTWRVTSTKESQAYGLSVDLAKIADCNLGKGNARILNMIEDGLEIVHPPLVGFDVNKPLSQNASTHDS